MPQLYHLWVARQETGGAWTEAIRINPYAYDRDRAEFLAERFLDVLTAVGVTGEIYAVPTRQLREEFVLTFCPGEGFSPEGGFRTVRVTAVPPTARPLVCLGVAE